MFKCVCFLKLLGCLCSDSKNVLKLKNCSGEIQSPGHSEVLKLGPGPDEFVPMALKLIPKNNCHISEINSLVCVTKFSLSVTMTSNWKICSLLNQQEHTQRPKKQWFDSLICPLAVLYCWLLTNWINWTEDFPLPEHNQDSQSHMRSHLQKLYKHPDYCSHVNKYHGYYHFIYKYVIWCDYNMKLTAWCF